MSSSLSGLHCTVLRYTIHIYRVNYFGGPLSGKLPLRIHLSAIGNRYASPDLGHDLPTKAEHGRSRSLVAGRV